MSGFVKVYSSILDSSIWLEDAETRIVWFTLLAMADSEGFVEASVGGIAHRARVERKKCEEALLKFESPDADSKDPSHEGRRIERVHRGFRLLNYRAYREQQTDSQAKAAERAKRYRDRRRERDASRPSRGVTLNHGLSRTEAEAEEEADTEEEKKEESEAADPRGTSATAPDGCPWGPLVRMLKAHGRTLGEKEPAAWLEAMWPELESAAAAESPDGESKRRRMERLKRIMHARWRRYLEGDRLYREPVVDLAAYERELMARGAK